MSLDAFALVRRAARSAPPPLNLADFGGAYSGRVAIMCGGTTATERDLSRIRCPILGVNKSYRFIEYPRTFAHLLSGIVSACNDAPAIAALWPGMPLFSWRTPPGGMPHNSSLFILGQCSAFNLDASKGGIRWLGAAVASLQLVVFMGFDEIVFVGLDLKRRAAQLKAWEVFADSPLNPYDPTRDYQIQAAALDDCWALIRHARPDVRVLNVSHDSACDVFERANFDEVFA